VSLQISVFYTIEINTLLLLMLLTTTTINVVITASSTRSTNHAISNDNTSSLHRHRSISVQKEN